jgi:lactam utilization protein B
MGSQSMGMTINCDMGEGFGLYRLGNDAALMPHIDLANVACGFHASDPSIMHATVRLAKQHGVKIGAHRRYRTCKASAGAPWSSRPTRWKIW